MDLFENLNERQIEAVKHIDGPMLVIAGAGSGKTRALTSRIAYLIKEKGVSPFNILAVTFTNKAANEMKERVAKFLHNDVYGGGFFDKNPQIGTFHSICVRILRRHAHLIDLENSFAIYDTADQQILMKNIMEESRIDPKKINPKAILAHISQAKNQLIGHKEYQQYANSYFNEKVAELYPKYQDALILNNALDFDDILMKTVLLFQKNPEILANYQQQFRYISVDEYQDTNYAQYVLIKMLAEKHRNLVVIGDVDQSIYSWRGATIKNILDFEKDYPQAKVVILEQNYRSTQVILDAADSIIKKNSQRKEKKLWTLREGGQKIKHLVADNERHEAELIAREILGDVYACEAPQYHNFVILYRTNAQSRVIEEVFLRHGIPYKIVGGIRFYERKEIKDILAYLKIVQNQHDSVGLMRIINTPSRKIGAKTLEVINNFAAQNHLSLFNAMLSCAEIPELKGKKIEEIEKFTGLIKKLQRHNNENTAAGMIKHVLDLSGYKAMINDGGIEGEARLENVQELISVAHKYDSLEAGLSLNIFLEEVSLIADIDSFEKEENAVTLMTVHSAKGLEFPIVFIAGLEEGIFPHSRSMLEVMELEEERRLMYVAMTRAMDKLFLLNARQRMLYGESKTNAPSQFIADIGEDLLESPFGGGRKHLQIGGLGRIGGLGGQPIPVESINNFDVFINEVPGAVIEVETGDKVKHDVFGAGIVVDVKGGVVTVAFEDPRVGIKKLALSVAPLKKI